MGEVSHSAPEGRDLLKRQLGLALRRQKLRALLLVVPLLLFVTATFIYPIGGLLTRSAYAPEFSEGMPRTAAALSEWDRTGLPPESAWEALVLDLQDHNRQGTAGKIAATLNVELPGARSLIIKTARLAPRLTPPYRTSLAAAEDGWKNPVAWAAMKTLANSFTDRFYLAAVDHRIDADGSVVAQPSGRQIYVPLFVRTFAIGGLVTLCCLLLGFPVAYWLSVLPMRYSNLLMIMVLLPFWTSLLVRTTAWIVLLQDRGVINSLLVWTGLIHDEGRLRLIFNSTGTVIAMTHILLPFMILPLYSVMKTVPPTYMRAARSLGANQFTAFVRIYLPQTKAGVAAGCLLVFILSLGYYITPALVGGESGTLISNMIAYHIQKSLNWGLAAALSALLLASVLLLYWAYNRLAQVDGLKLG
ncbi:MAG: ABC transporter permease [Mesorhizobium sp. 61-13]|mgnify:CR=1 FL=1|nr:ABC transporter permease [Mesorhizobium sp.]OJU50482.1 MAG: ABC transporter permease [Mesorhizobium sp. 61-13]